MNNKRELFFMELQNIYLKIEFNLFYGICKHFSLKYSSILTDS
jgi:hypothetical protein